MPEGNSHQGKTKYLFRNYLSYQNTKVSEINSNPIVIYDAIAIVHSVPSEKTWDSLFQTLVKALRTQEEEIVLVFNDYSNKEIF